MKILFTIRNSAKSRLLFLLFLLLPSSAVLACDICGCGVGSYYIGLLPEFRKRFVGIRYQHKALQSHLRPGGGTSYLTADETYQVAELWTGWNIGKRFRVMGFLPYNFNERSNQGDKGSLQGLGDVAVSGYYKLFDQRKAVSGDRLLVHSLWLGTSLKLPTGHYDPGEEESAKGSLNTFQLGSGSVDMSLLAAYDIRIQDLGLNCNLSYKMNTENGDGYRYGNKFTANMLAYYKIRPKQEWVFAPNAGVLFETSAKDAKNGSLLYESGGHSLMGVAGLEASFGRWGLGGNYQLPLEQSLGGGTVKAGNRWLLQMSFSF